MNPVIEDLKKQYNGKKVLVVGLGLLGGGMGVAGFFAGLGADVTVTDLKGEEALQDSINQLKKYNIKYILGRHVIESFVTSDLIFKAPKMRWDAPEIVAAIEKGIPVDMEISFFLRHCPAQVIGVTGTRGKSTTTQMIYEVLKNTSSAPVHIGGNMPHISTVNLLEDIQPLDTVVLEVSSWQLSSMHRHKISPHIAVFTSFYPDHLDYYKTLNEYLYDKEAIYMYQKPEDTLVISKQAKSAIQDQRFPANVIEYSMADFPLRLERLKGDHNIENAAAALKVTQILQIDEAKADAIIASFRGLPYRLQQIRRIHDVTFIDDTTSTTPTATVKAIEALSDKPIVLLLGGNAKNLPYEELFSALEKVSFIVLLQGTFTNQIQEKLEVRFAAKITRAYEDLKRAVEIAYEKASELGDSYVVLSPAATSFSMFKNEFHRGDEFDRIVGEL